MFLRCEVVCLMQGDLLRSYERIDKDTPSATDRQVSAVVSSHPSHSIPLHPIHPASFSSSNFIFLSINSSNSASPPHVFTIPSPHHHYKTPSPLQDPITTTRPHHHYKTLSPLQDLITTTPFHQHHTTTHADRG